MSASVPSHQVKETPDSEFPAPFTCQYCGQEHEPVALHPQQKALCTQCGLVLARGTRFSADATIALIVTALILAVPATYLPFITVSKLGSVRTGHLFSGARALLREDMGLLSVWVTLCAQAAPILMLVVLAALTVPGRLGKSWGWTHTLERGAVALDEWAMPEVYVLAVLVALTKLGTLVDTTIGPGFWCYAAMSVLLLLCWRNYRLEPELFAARENDTAHST